MVSQILAAPWDHLAKGLVADILSVVAPLPLVGHPIVVSTDPKIVLLLRLEQILPQALVVELQRFGQLTVAILALEVRVEEVFPIARNVVALVADAVESRRTHGVHPFDAPTGNVLPGVGVLRQCAGVVLFQVLVLLEDLLGLDCAHRKEHRQQTPYCDCYGSTPHYCYDLIRLPIYLLTVRLLQKLFHIDLIDVVNSL